MGILFRGLRIMMCFMDVILFIVLRWFFMFCLDFVVLSCNLEKYCVSVRIRLFVLVGLGV